MQIDLRLRQFIDRCDRVAAERGIASATLSTKLFCDGKRLGAISSGKSDIGIGRLARAERDLVALERTFESKRGLADAAPESADAR